MLRNTSPQKFVQTLVENAPQGPIGIVSQTGGGKNQVLRSLLTSVIAPTQDPASRVIVWAVSGDLFSKIPCPDRDLLLFNPSDARGVYWDIASDLTDPLSISVFADSLASEIIPATPEPFWRAAARQVLETSVTSLLGGPWTWGDLAKKVETYGESRQCLPTLLTWLQLAADRLCPTNRLPFSISAWYAHPSVDKLPGDPWRGHTDLQGRRVLVFSNPKPTGENWENLFDPLIEVFLKLRLLKTHTKPEETTWLFIPSIDRVVETHRSSLRGVVAQGRSQGLQLVASFPNLGWLADLSTPGQPGVDLFLPSVFALILGRSEHIVFRTKAVYGGLGGSEFRGLMGCQPAVKTMLGPTPEGIQTLGVCALDNNVRKLLWPYVTWGKVRETFVGPNV